MVVFESEEAWVAQGLEYDVAGQGPTAGAGGVQLLAGTFAAEVWLRSDGSYGGMDAIGPAPEKFVRMFEEANR